MDVQTAFLNGKLSEEGYTYQAPEFEKTEIAMTGLGSAAQILGMDIKQGLAQGTITLSQEKHTLSVLKRSKMDAGSHAHTPGTGAGHTASTATNALLLSDVAKKEYQSLVGSLVFLITCTRFDISFATMEAARHMAKGLFCIANNRPLEI